MDLFKSAQQQSDSQEPLADDPTTSSWSFGSLIKTLATKSESVIGSYRREFEEFGSELKKETSIIRQVASRIPDSLEIGASVASESLESVGQAIDDIGVTVWKSTAKIISHGKESFSLDRNRTRTNQGLLSVNKPYSRYEMMLLAIQSDKGTYVKEPEDLEEFENWCLGFKLDEKKNEIFDLVNGEKNKAVKEIYEKIVPMEVDDEMFWKRYYYKVFKLEQIEEARVKLVKRAISGEEDEDLSWDLDEEEEKVESREVSCKDSDISVISTQPSLPEVEDLGWDKMEEDIRSHEGGKGNEEEDKSDWRRRVSVVDEEEDLSWDIEDDDDDDDDDSSVKH